MDCQIDKSRAASLSQALAVNSSLACLDLNSIGESGTASLSNTLAVNSALTKLHLRGTVLVILVLRLFTRLLQSTPP